MGLSSKKQTTKGTTQQQQTQQSTATTVNEVPDWIKQPAMNLAGNISGLLGQGYQQFMPQVSGLGQLAVNNAAGLGLSDKFGQAGSVLSGVGDVTAGNVSYDPVTGASLLDQGLERYYNPFRQQVLDTTLADYDTQAGKTRAAQAAAAARNSAFSGSRYGVQEAATEGVLGAGRATAEAGLLSQMYGQATSLAEADAARRQQAALANQGAGLSASQSNAQLGLSAQTANQQAALERARQLAQLGLSEGSETRANLGVQATIGGQQTDAENAQRQYPLQFQQQIASLLAGLNPELYSGRTVSSSGSSAGTGSSTSTTKTRDSLLSNLGQVAQIAALFA